MNLAQYIESLKPEYEIIDYQASGSGFSIKRQPGGICSLRAFMGQFRVHQYGTWLDPAYALDCAENLRRVAQIAMRLNELIAQDTNS